MPAKSRLGFDVVLGDACTTGPRSGRSPAIGRPGPAAVGAPQQVGLEVAALVVVEGGVDGVRVVRRRARGRRRRSRSGTPGNAARRVRQAAAAVLGDLDQAVVGADVEQALAAAATRSSDDDVAVERGRGVLGHRVDAPDAAHHRQRVAVELRGSGRR